MSEDAGGPLEIRRSLEVSGPEQVDLLASSLRADTSDLNAFLEVLATKLAGALPNQTTVQRQNKLFSREHPIREIAVTLGEHQYRISRESQRPAITQRAKVVRGIVLKTEQLSMDRWINELATDLAQEAAESEQARIALERFLL
jgi:hypothetical protein